MKLNLIQRSAVSARKTERPPLPGRVADSTLALRKSVYRRLLEKPLGKVNLEDIKPKTLADLFDKAKAERGPGPAVHARELVLLVYRFAIGKGVEVANPVDAIQRKTIATFQPRERNLDRREIKSFFDLLQHTATPAEMAELAKLLENSPARWRGLLEVISQPDLPRDVEAIAARLLTHNGLTDRPRSPVSKASGEFA